jgi:hypothetical protein
MLLGKEGKGLNPSNKAYAWQLTEAIAARLELLGFTHLVVQ